MFKYGKSFFILLGIIFITILAAILLRGKNKYLAEKIKILLQKKKLDDKSKELETKRNENNDKIRKISSLQGNNNVEVEKLLDQNKKLEEKIENIKKDVVVKEKELDDIMTSLKEM